MNDERRSPISPRARMNVSGILRREGSETVCVMIEDDGRELELRIPDGEILHNNGYTEKEAEEIISHLNSRIDEIMDAARGINPMKAFMS